MQIKTEDLMVIDKDDKYKHDLLSRKQEVENISKFIETVESSLL